MSGTDLTDLLVVNPLPWKRTVSGPVSRYVVDPRGNRGDQTAARHFQDRAIERQSISGFTTPDGEDPETKSYLLQPTTVPGYGYARVSADDFVLDTDWPFDERGTLETTRYRVEFDRQSGGIDRLVDEKLSHDWVDAEADVPLAGFVHEQVVDESTARPRRHLFRYPSDGVNPHDAVTGAVDTERGFQPDWHGRRRRPDRVVRHRVYETPEGYDVRQQLSVSHLPGDVSLRMLFPHHDDSIVVEADWELGTEAHPESTYLSFPFDLPDPAVSLDVGGQAMRPGRDQLPGSCHDYYTVQRWVDFSDGERGVTVGCPINPLVQLGSFHFGENRSTADLDRAHLHGWVTNNYWDTNFRAYQPGRVRARYHLLPYGGAFDESRAHRFGMASEHWEPVTQTTGERGVPSPPLPAEGTLLSLPEPPVLILQIRPTAGNVGVHPGGSGGDGTSGGSGRGDIAVLVKNAADDSETAAFRSAALAIESAWTATVLGAQPSDERVERVSDGVTVELDPRELRTILLDVEPSRRSA